MRLFGRRGFFPDNMRMQRVPVAEIPGLITAEVAAIDNTAALGLTGNSGAIRAGLASGIGTTRYNGYISAPAVISPVGASTNLRTRPQTAFPATSGPIAAEGSVQSALGALRRLGTS